MNLKTLFHRAEPVDAPAIITGAAVRALERIARQSAWDRWHASLAPLAVDETATLRGRTVTLRLFISRHGATYCRRWRVDGRAWRATDVWQTFGT
jgi:hypothetical protein